MQVNDLRLLGIPRSRLKITRIYPHHDKFSKDSLKTFQFWFHLNFGIKNLKFNFLNFKLLISKSKSSMNLSV